MVEAQAEEDNMVPAALHYPCSIFGPVRIIKELAFTGSPFSWGGVIAIAEAVFPISFTFHNTFGVAFLIFILQVRKTEA